MYDTELRTIIQNLFEFRNSAKRYRCLRCLLLVMCTP